MQKIINNLSINYTDEGSGPVILMLHGWGTNLHTFDSLSSQLQSNYRVIRLDLPGFGQSQKPEEAWNLSNYVNFIKSFTEKLDITPEILLGHSFGGRVIIKGSAQQILKSNKNVLISSAGIYKGSKPKNVLLKSIAKIGKVLTLIPPFIFWREKIRKKFYSNIQSDYADTGPMQKTFLNIIKEDLSAYAEKIETPTLLIWGSDDKVTPLEDGKKFAELIKNSKIKSIKESGHFVHKIKPEETAKLIKKFNA